MDNHEFLIGYLLSSGGKGVFGAPILSGYSDGFLAGYLMGKGEGADPYAPINKDLCDILGFRIGDAFGFDTISDSVNVAVINSEQ